MENVQGGDPGVRPEALPVFCCDELVAFCGYLFKNQLFPKSQLRPNPRQVTRGENRVLGQAL